MHNITEYYIEDFTESNYIRLLKIAKQKYQFSFFDNIPMIPHVLWRHDVDCSVHRALALAKIEAKLGIQSTYFLLLHSEFYNALEKNIVDLVKQILALGHQIGLHYDMKFYPTGSYLDFESYILHEKNIIDYLFNTDIKAISFHNPDVSGLTNQNCIAGMINTYGQSIMDNYQYCSDSNGYWRFKRLEEVMLDETENNLHILTHPAWWVPDCAKPRDRIVRCVEGRANFVMAHYDEFLAAQKGRVNVGK